MINTKFRISILGCGRFGKLLADNLINHGNSVKGSTTSENKLQTFSDSGIIPFLIQLDSISSAISGFLDSEILIVSLTSKNIEGFKNLISHIEKSPVKNIIFISSTSVYEETNEIVTEQTPIKSSPLSEIEKLFTENPNFSTTVIRFGGLFGYDRKPGNFYSRGSKINNPEGFVNMIHLDDCVSIASQIIEKGIWNETFNACADTHPTRREFYTKSALEIGREIPEFTDNEINKYKIINSQKLKVILNFEFKYPDLLASVF